MTFISFVLANILKKFNDTQFVIQIFRKHFKIQITLNIATLKTESIFKNLNDLPKTGTMPASTLQ